MLNVFKRIVAEVGFKERLQQTQDRIDAIEALHRTNELVVKNDDTGGSLRLLLVEKNEEEEKEERKEIIIPSPAHKPDSRYV